MVNKLKKVDLIFIISLLLVLITLFILGIFFDLKLSISVYNKTSVFGMIGASFGELPAWFMLSFTSVIVYKVARLLENKSKRILCYIFSVILLFVSCGLIYFSESVVYNGLSEFLNGWIRLLISLLLTSIFVFITFKVITVNDKYTLIRIGFIVLLTIALQIGIGTILKYIWSRPRFRLIAFGSGEYDVYDLFRACYQPGRGLAGIVFANEKSEQFKSFPSGHTSSAACSLLFFFIPSLNTKLTKSIKARIILIIFALIYTFAVAYSRIVYGAHYLTDVTFGFIITICSILLSILLEKKALFKVIKQDVKAS
jgi:PAP2 superfamily.